MIQFLNVEYDLGDDRGYLKQLVSKGWNQINVIYSKTNMIRGNHYHKVNRELFYIIKGRFNLKLRNIVTNENQEYEIHAGNFFVIEPFTYHIFDFMEDTILISCYDVGVIDSNNSMDIYSN